MHGSKTAAGRPAGLPACVPACSLALPYLPAHPTTPQTALQAAGLSPDVHTYTSLISGCAYGRQAALARELWRQMEERGIRPNVVTHNAMLKVRRVDVSHPYLFVVLRYCHNVVNW